VRVWYWDNAKKTSSQIAILKGHSDWVRSVCWSPDGTRLSSASADTTVRIWDADTGAQLAELNGHFSIVNSVSWSPDGSRLASASWDNTVQVWNAHTGSQLDELKGHSSYVNSVSWNPDGSRLASASSDETVRVWYWDNATKTGSQLAILKGHSHSVTSVNWSPDGTKIASASIDKTVRVWEKLELYPEINEELLDLLPKEQSKNYIKSIMSDYNEFSKYFVRNYLIEKNGVKEIKNMNYNNFFKLIHNSLEVDNLSKFSNIIIKFINSIPEELNNSFFNGFNSSDARKFILDIYKNIISEYIPYLNNYFNDNNRPNYSKIYRTVRNSELDLLLKNFKSNKLKPYSSITIVYEGEIGINAGGLSREFFKNIEKQLNDKKDLTDKEIISVLVLSKVNKNPIYLNNDKLKELILNKIVNSIIKHVNKRVIKTLLGSDITSKDLELKYETFLLNGNNNLNNNKYGYSHNGMKKYITNKVEENSNKNNTYNINLNNNIKFTDDILVNYKNFLDFYLSHFINFKLSVDDIIDKLQFRGSNQEFELKFKALLKNLSPEDLKKFNECISGSSKLQSKYEIEIVPGANSIYSTYHTCFQRMDIHGMQLFTDTFLQFTNNSNNYNKLIIKEQSKEAFMQTVNAALGAGFNMV
jgi:hypothetical protein